MSDIFREVEEEVRRERLEKIWKEYGDYIVAAVALLILAAAAFRLWTYYESRERTRASGSFIAAQQLLENGQARAAAQQFSRLSQTAPSGYAKLSQLSAADALAASDNKAGALNLYRKLIDSSDEMLGSIARVRAAWILVEGAPKSQVESTLGGLAAAGSPWQPVAGEILAYADLRAHDKQRALAEFRALAHDPKAPEGVRRRSDAMVTYLTAGGDHDVGKPLYPSHPVSGLLTPRQKGTAGAGGAQATPSAAPAAGAPAAAAKGKPPQQATSPVTIDTNLPQPPANRAAENPPKGQSPR
ncbi:MAG TPA: tetratricopeptide repeat protein [Rhizomicrobium sp.]|nr:tetratricopeptide repeat protein [Rhizomicrobium sp.]